MGRVSDKFIIPLAHAAPAAPQESSLNVGRLVVAGLLIAAVLLSASTYFSALSQYSTADQTTTAKRLNAFFADVTSIKWSDCSLISELLIAYPANWLDSILARFYQVNDPIFWDIHYTQILPFSFLQVCISLAFMVYLAALVVSLVPPAVLPANAFLLTLLIVMNFPMLKGIAKVLKYDILSTLFAAIAILYYVGYRALGRNNVTLVSVFCALAYLEKDTTLAILSLIVIFELMIIPFLAPSPLAALKAAIRFVVRFVLIFLFTCALLVPKLWLRPVEMLSMFESVPLYFVNIAPWLAVALFVPIGLAYAVVPRVLAKSRDRFLFKISGPAVAIFFSIISLVVVMLGASATLFQSNIMFDPTIAGNDIDVEALRAQSIYVARAIAYSAITTMDHSALVQHVKLFWSMVRAIFYTLPEVTLLIIVAAAPLFLLMARGSRPVREQHAAALVLLLAFPVAMLTAFSLADLPFEPKYLVLVSLLLMIYGIYSMLLWLKRLGPRSGSVLAVLVAILMVQVALSASPSYLRYKNILRDRGEENAAALDMNRYIWWTWPGWGETSYPIGQFLEKNTVGPVSVAFDYWAPFYKAPNLTWVSADFNKCRSLDGLRRELEALKSQAVEFQIVSKNMSNRQWCLNQILRRVRNKAVFVDTQQGVEYGWLIKVSDTIDAFRPDPSGAPR